MAKKKSKATTKKTDDYSFDISTDDPDITFSLGGESIKDTVSSFHRLVLKAQAAAFESRDEVEDYSSEFAENLNKKFRTKLTITPAMAYRMMNHIFDVFHEQKKT